MFQEWLILRDWSWWTFWQPRTTNLTRALSCMDPSTNCLGPISSPWDPSATSLLSIIVRWKVSISLKLTFLFVNFATTTFFLGLERETLLSKVLFNYGPRVIPNFERYLDSLNRLAVHQIAWMCDKHWLTFGKLHLHLYWGHLARHPPTHPCIFFLEIPNHNEWTTKQIQVYYYNYYNYSEGARECNVPN